MSRIDESIRHQVDCERNVSTYCGELQRPSAIAKQNVLDVIWRSKKDGREGDV